MSESEPAGDGRDDLAMCAKVKGKVDGWKSRVEGDSPDCVTSI